jgi:hypothetical protein
VGGLLAVHSRWVQKDAPGGTTTCAVSDESFLTLVQSICVLSGWLLAAVYDGQGRNLGTEVPIQVILCMILMRKITFSVLRASGCLQLLSKDAGERFKLDLQRVAFVREIVRATYSSAF